MAPLIVAALLVASASPKSTDACALLDAKTVASVQGQAPASTKPSEHTRGPLVAEQCYFALPDAARSVSLEVTRPGSAQGRAALRERWERLRGEGPAPAREEEEEQGAAPRAVKGVGRAAVWSGNQKAGALYVLGKDVIVRVSVGGTASEPDKIKACSTLAKAALRKLR